MSLRNDIDPELALLRAIGRSLDGPLRQKAESARFNLFAAAESTDIPLASRWLEVCSVVLAVAELPPTVRASAERAISRILDTIEEYEGVGEP